MAASNWKEVIGLGVAGNFKGQLEQAGIDWLIEILDQQRDEGPLEDISQWLHAGGDESIVALYDNRRFDQMTIRDVVRTRKEVQTPGLSPLRQKVS